MFDEYEHALCAVSDIWYFEESSMSNSLRKQKRNQCNWYRIRKYHNFKVHLLGNNKKPTDFKREKLELLSLNSRSRPGFEVKPKVVRIKGQHLQFVQQFQYCAELCRNNAG